MVFKTLLALTLLAAGADSVKLSRTYAPEATTVYEVSAVDKGHDLGLEGKLTFKVAGKTEDKKTPVSVTSPSIAVMKGGTAVDDQGLDEKLKFDNHNMPLELEVNGPQSAIIIVAIAGYLPDADVEVGKAYDIKWESGNTKLQGKGTLEKIEEKDGKKIATIKIAAELFPGDDDKGTLSLTSTLDLSTGDLLTSTGSVVIESQNDFVVTIKKTN